MERMRQHLEHRAGAHPHNLAGIAPMSPSAALITLFVASCSTSCPRHDGPPQPRRSGSASSSDYLERVVNDSRVIARPRPISRRACEEGSAEGGTYSNRRRHCRRRSLVNGLIARADRAQKGVRRALLNLARTRCRPEPPPATAARGPVRAIRRGPRLRAWLSCSGTAARRSAAETARVPAVSIRSTRPREKGDRPRARFVRELPQITAADLSRAPADYNHPGTCHRSLVARAIIAGGIAIRSALAESLMPS